MKALIFSLLFFSFSAFCQTYTVVTASSGGDIGDVIYRAALSRVNAIPELSPGGDGLIAPNKFVEKPQGNYLLLSGLLTQQVVNPMTRADMATYTDADFAPVTLLASTFFVVLANRKIDLSQGVGHRVAVSGGNAMFLLQVISGKSGAALYPIPYKNISQGVIDMLRGDVALSLVQASTAYPFIESGKAYGVATTARARVARMAGTPTLSEQFPGLVIPAAWGLYGQRGMAPSTSVKLNKSIAAALAEPATQAVYEKHFLQAPEQLGPQALKDYVAQQRKDYHRFAGGMAVQ